MEWRVSHLPLQFARYPPYTMNLRPRAQEEREERRHLEEVEVGRRCSHLEEEEEKE